MKINVRTTAVEPRVTATATAVEPKVTVTATALKVLVTNSDGSPIYGQPFGPAFFARSMDRCEELRFRATGVCKCSYESGFRCGCASVPVSDGGSQYPVVC
jgi:hypothetical protein